MSLKTGRTRLNGKAFGNDLSNPDGSINAVLLHCEHRTVLRNLARIRCILRCNGTNLDKLETQPEGCFIFGLFAKNEIARRKEAKHPRHRSRGCGTCSTSSGTKKAIASWIACQTTGFREHGPMSRRKDAPLLHVLPSRIGQPEQCAGRETTPEKFETYR